MENKTQIEIKNYMEEKNYKIVSPIPTNKNDKITYICICNVEKTKAFKEILRVKNGKTRTCTTLKYNKTPSEENNEDEINELTGEIWKNI